MGKKYQTPEDYEKRMKNPEEIRERERLWIRRQKKLVALIEPLQNMKICLIKKIWKDLYRQSVMRSIGKHVEQC